MKQAVNEGLLEKKQFSLEEGVIRDKSLPPCVRYDDLFSGGFKWFLVLQ